MKFISNLIKLLKNSLIKIIIKKIKIKNISNNNIIKTIFNKIIKILAKFKNNKRLSKAKSFIKKQKFKIVYF